MQIKNILVGMVLSIGLGVSGVTSALVINTSYDLNQGLNGVASLDDGVVNIANGDHVDLTVNFLDNKALNIKDGGEYFMGWLYAGDNNSSFTIENVVFELLGFVGVGGAQSSYNLGTVSGGAAHLGAALNNFLGFGQEVTFSGFRVNYDVVSIAQSPHAYESLWFLTGANVGIVDAIPVPEPGMLLLMLSGIFALSLKRARR